MSDSTLNGWLLRLVRPGLRILRVEPIREPLRKILFVDVLALGVLRQEFRIARMLENVTELLGLKRRINGNRLA